MTEILIVDDVKYINQMIGNYLRKDGYTITSVYNGREAISAIEQGGAFDVMLLDIIMPDQDGFDVLNYIDKHDIDIPVIAISGGGLAISGDVALKSIAMRVDVTLEKPIKPDVLKAALDKVLDISNKKSGSVA